MSERRKAHRFVVDPDRAQVTVKAGSSCTSAVMTDMSSNGIGLLVLRGLHLDAGQVIKVEIDDVVHDCEVVQCMAEEMFQRVGARRLKEHFDMPDPMKEIIERSSGGDMSAVGSVLTITLGLCVAALIFGVIQLVDFENLGASSKNPGLASPEVRERVISEAERIKQEKERAIREAAAELKARAQQNEEQAAVLITGTGDFSWSALVSQLRLSKTQQRDLLQLIETGTNGTRRLSPFELRQQANALLTDSQRKHVKRMLTAGRF